MKNIGILLVLLIGFGSAGMAQKPLKFAKTAWYDALAQAKSEQKSLLFYISQPGCEYCKEFDQVTLKNPELRDFLQKNFVLVKHSVKTKYGEAIARDFHLSSTPAILLQKPDSKKEIRILYNNQNAASFLLELQKFLNEH